MDIPLPEAYSIISHLDASLYDQAVSEEDTSVGLNFDILLLSAFLFFTHSSLNLIAINSLNINYTFLLSKLNMQKVV